jgi:hypothetical protein
MKCPGELSWVLGGDHEWCEWVNQRSENVLQFLKWLEVESTGKSKKFVTV